MAIEITMPALSPTMEEGNLTKWLVKAGDTVEAGDVIAEIETDKATMEVEAVDEGVVAEILVPEGTEGVAVNAVIAVLIEEGEELGAQGADDAKGAQEASGIPATAPASEAADTEASAEAVQDSAKTAPPSPAPSASPSAPGAPATDLGKDHGDVRAALASTPMKLADVGKGEARIKASPLARRIAALKGIDLGGVAGSGPKGRIVRADVEAAVVGGAAGTALIPTQAAEVVRPASPDGLIMPQVLDDRVYAPGSYDLVPLDGMRRTVARRLTQSFMQVPHFPLTVDIQLDRLLAARSGMNAAAPEGVKISVNDMLIKAAGLALIDEPDCNASYTDEGIAYHKSAHISVAVAIDGGLITPVIRDAQSKALRQISSEMKDLATRARDRKLKPQEYMGGTFSLSNLGMFGIKDFASIINPPEGMIMSVGAGEKRPIVLEDGTLGVGTMMSVTLTCDHRVIGGAEGARWLAAFKRYVETPEAMLL
ncbi:MAG: pyruvate dehydrogenase complex dihydrolipoamide acetyltransferase [Pseudomonadota bacterium]